MPFEDIFRLVLEKKNYFHISSKFEIFDTQNFVKNSKSLNLRPKRAYLLGSNIKKFCIT